MLKIFFLGVLYCFLGGFNLSFGSESKKLTLLTPFPSQWTRATWLEEVIRDFKIEEGVEIVSLDLVKKTKTLDPNKRRHALRDILEEVVKTGKVDWDIMFYEYTQGWAINKHIWDSIQNVPSSDSIRCDLTKFPQNSEICRGLPYNQQHWQSIHKMIFHNFATDKEMVDLHHEAMKKTREWQWQGLYGLLFESTPRGIFYNYSLAQKIGVKIPETGMTWEDFEQVIARVYEYNQRKIEKRGKLVRALEMPFGSDFVQHLVRSMIERKIRDGMKIDPVKTIYRLIDYLVGIAKLDPVLRYELKKSSSKASLNSFSGQEEPQASRPDWFGEESMKNFLSGKSLFYAGEWKDYPIMREKMGSKASEIKVAEYPSIEPRLSMDWNFIGGFNVMVNSPNKALAKKFLKFIAQKQYMSSWATYSYTIPGVKNSQKFIRGKGPISSFLKTMQSKYQLNVNSSENWDFFSKHLPCTAVGGKAWNILPNWFFTTLISYRILSGFYTKEQAKQEVVSRCKD